MLVIKHSISLLCRQILIVALLIIACGAQAQYSQDDYDSVQKMYIAYYGRPGDPEGLAFWAGKLAEGNGDLSSIIESFGASDEYTSRFGSLSSSELVNNIYLQILTRDADPSGLDFYVGRLDNNVSTLASIALQIADGIDDGTSDANIYHNKLTVANAYSAAVEETGSTYSTSEVDAAKALLDAVDGTAESLEASLASVDSLFTTEPTVALLTEWIVNTSGELSAFLLNSQGSAGIAVNVQSVTEESVNGASFARVQTEGIPNYVVTFTQEQVDALNARPRADLQQQNSQDFVSEPGATTASAGDVVGFGGNIGYRSFSGDVACGNGAGYGYWPPGPTCPDDQAKDGYFPLEPVDSSADCEIGAAASGYAVNGVSIYSWFDGQSYNNEGVWQSLAPFAEVYDVDVCGGHAANGDYHHHFYSDCWGEVAGEDKSGHSPIYGFAADGYAVYGPWHSTGVVAQSCWVRREYNANSASGCGTDGDRTCLLVDQYDLSQGTIAASSNGPTTAGEYTSLSSNSFVTTSGFFFEDYYYDSICTSTDGEQALDQFNGHEHDNLGYHYHLTIVSNTDTTPAFPFTFGPRFKGQLQANAIASCFSSAGGVGVGGPPPGGPGGAP